jgi:hypothetical protein
MGDAPNDVPARVAVLEHIAKETKESIADLRTETRDLRTEMRQDFADMRAEMRDQRTEMRQDVADLHIEMRQGFADMRTEMRLIRTDARSDFRWLLGIMLGGSGALLGIMAHGFHWL